MVQNARTPINQKNAGLHAKSTVFVYMYRAYVVWLLNITKDCACLCTHR